ncbi:MAG: L-serine ammonia-lyase, iron-sulfur-dependent, subunit alpha [Kiritimatiellae bacterium]|nr:L-serine ammonia-lyase, iron-sulfur-dependent, subunit alpha [Kiritimatiellia bacterium]
MKSLRELYRVGRGPSSSHTMGPVYAAAEFLRRFPDAASFEVVLFDSLAATGRGHFTDKAVKDTLGAKRTKIVWKPDAHDEFHPNGMLFTAFGRDGAKLGEWKVYSVGGGALCEKGKEVPTKSVYRYRNMEEIVSAATRAGVPLWQLVEDAEGPAIWDYLRTVYNMMMSAIDRGLSADGVLPGGLRLARKARAIHIKAKMQAEKLRRTGLLVAYAHAVSEENAALGEIVTAPTCGSCGTLPAVLRYLREALGSSEMEILHALAVAGLVGNVVKRNGSISGAEVGCQGEVGVACAMASAAAAYLMGGSPRQCECAAEIGLEHFLGLTCDPVKGLVQIPCIERNALAATRAVVAGEMSVLSDGAHVVSFDTVVKTMLETGHDLPRLYRETSDGGLSRFVRR